MASDSGLPPRRDGWHHAVHLDELWEGEMLGLRLGAVEVLLVHLEGGELRAYDNRCPHARALLSEGSLDGGLVQCSAHLWTFDARSGRGVQPANCRLRAFAVKVVDDAVLVRPVADTD